MVQKVYLGVGTVLTADEARAILNQAGAQLPMGGLPARPAPAPQLAAASLDYAERYLVSRLGLSGRNGHRLPAGVTDGT